MDFSCPLEQSLEFEGISHTPRLEDNVGSQALSLSPPGSPRLERSVDVESPAVLLSPSGCPPTAAPLAKKPLCLMRFLAVLLLLGVCLAGYLITARSLPEPATTTAANAAAASQANGNGNNPMRGCLYDQKVKEEMDKKSPKDRDYEKLYLQNEKSRAQKRVEERERGQSNKGNGNRNGNGNGNGGGRRLLQQATQLDVPVTFHVILPAGLATLAAANSNGGLGALQKQIARLNTDFANGFTGTTDIWGAVRSVNPSPKWNFYLDSYKEVFAAMGDSPHVQSTREVGKLNIWIGDMTGSNANTLGYAYYIGTGKNLRSYDGVYLLYTTLPGGTSSYNMGRTATHEVGHFFNLPHIWGETSGAGCTNGNDGIADTVAADDANWGCRSGNTVFCAGVTREMYENFMDYTDDSCMYMFTKMQNEVMKSAWGTVAWAQTNSGPASTSSSPSTSSSRSRSPSTSTSSSPSRTSTSSRSLSSSPSRSITSPSTSISPSRSITSPSPSRSITSPSTSTSRSRSPTFSYSLSLSSSPSRSITSPSTSRSPSPTSSSSLSLSTSRSATATPSKTPQSQSARTGVLIYIKPDDWPLETTWSLTGPTAAPVASGGPLESTDEQYKFLYLSPGQYHFRINDTESDGICCTWGNGIFRLFVGPNEVATGGSFGAFETKALQVPPNPFTCSGKELWLVMRTDSWPEETSWVMKDVATNQQVMAVAVNTLYLNKNRVYVSQICAQPGRSYSLVMRDSYGDGLAKYDPGLYQVVDVAQSTVLVTGGNFIFEETKTFVV
eukprot:g19393.t1